MAEKRTPQEMFDVFNRRYFRGHLPPCKVEWMAKPKVVDIPYDCAAVCTGFHEEGYETPICSGLIKVWKHFKPYPWIWKLLLLHEMAHWKLREHPVAGLGKPGQHGHAFHREMKRLARIGAFKHIW
jgi:hypothetical protein